MHQMIGKKYYPLLSFIKQYSEQFVKVAALTLLATPYPFTEIYAEKTIAGIKARQYRVEVLKRSQSLRVYLFKDLDNANPREGRILLLKQRKKNVMAFRILKIYPNESEFAAKRVKLYGKYKALDKRDRYLGIEKVSDISYTLSEEDLTDIESLEEAQYLPRVDEYDPELDSGTTPPPEELEEDTLNQIEIEDVEPIDNDKYWISAQFAFLRNNTAGGAGAYYNGGGLRFGYSISRFVFFSSAQVQDSFTLEFGAFLYKLLSFESSNDSYTVTPLIGTIRYNIYFTQNMIGFSYIGMMKNVVLTAGPDPSSNAISQLSSTQPSFGLGLMFKMGPRWHIRTDLGIDMIGLGLVLRF